MRILLSFFMIVLIVIFLIVFLTVAMLIVMAALKVSGELDRLEEKRKEEEDGRADREV